MLKETKKILITQSPTRLSEHRWNKNFKRDRNNYVEWKYIWKPTSECVLTSANFVDKPRPLVLIVLKISVYIELKIANGIDLSGLKTMTTWIIPQWLIEKILGTSVFDRLQFVTWVQLCYSLLFSYSSSVICYWCINAV